MLSWSLFQPLIRSILFSAITNGTLFAFRIWMTSAVWGLIPSLMSITRIARSAKLPPRFLKLLNAAWPGVSMNRNPGKSNVIFFSSIIGQAALRFSMGKRVKDIF